MTNVETKPTAAEWLAFIFAELEAGASFYVATYTRCTRIRQNNVESFRAAGYEVLKASGRSLYIRRGRRWDCIDLCQLAIRDERTDATIRKLKKAGTYREIDERNFMVNAPPRFDS